MKYKGLLILFAAAMLAMPSVAQKNLKDPAAVVGAMGEVIKHHHVAKRANTQKDAKLYDKSPVLPLVESVADKFRKDPYVLTGIGDRFFYTSRDTAMAYVFVRRSIAADPTYQPAYQLAGEMEDYWDNDSIAVEWYRRGIKANPKSPGCYESCAKLLAKINPDLILPTLTPMLDYDSTYQAYLKAARIYDALMVDKEAMDRFLNVYIDCVSKANPDSMTAYDYSTYQNYYYGFGDNISVLRICDQGLKRHPKSMTLNRQAMVSSYNLGRLDSTLMYAARMFENFNKVDSPRISAEDVRVYGMALQKKHKYPDAIGRFREVLAMDDATDAQRSDALERIAKCYQDQGDYAQAEREYLTYIEKREKDSLLSVRDLQLVANMYAAQAEEANGQDKIDALKKAGAVYERMGRTFPDQAVRAAYNGFRIALQIDTDIKNGAGVPYVEKIISLLESKQGRDDDDDQYLEVSYNYMAFYYINNKQVPQSLAYFKKVVGLGRDSEICATAKQNVELLTKRR